MVAAVVAVMAVGLVPALMALASVFGAGMSQLNHDEEEDAFALAEGLKVEHNVNTF